MQKVSKDWSREVCVCVFGGALLTGDPGGSTSGGLQSFRYASLTGVLKPACSANTDNINEKSSGGAFLLIFCFLSPSHMVSVSLLILEQNSSNIVCFMMARRIHVI